ncbi:MAG: hypothetical protein RLZZ507_3902 [Cyanobacteriota bacterium]|jgi:hypothetical protein
MLFYQLPITQNSCILEITKTLYFTIMTTHFITAEIDLQETPTELQKAIEAELKKQGEPLRWAVTSVDEEQEKATVEAVVTTANAE